MSINEDTLVLPPLPMGGLAQDAPPLLYWSVYKTLLAEIEDDAASVGKALPIERHISEHFGVSRFTVRQALDLLEKEGYIRKQRAKPAMVVSRTGLEPAERNLSRLGDVLRPTVIRHTQVQSYGRARHAQAARLLGLSEEAELYLLRITHRDAERVIGFSEVYLPESVGNRVTQQDFIDAADHGPLFVYPVVESHTGLKVDHAKVTVGAAPAARAAGTELASLLDGSALVRVQYVFYCAGQAMQVTTNWMDARAYSVAYELQL